MPIDYDALMQFPFEDREHAYRPKDCMLYALGVGLGADPLDERQLQFVYEKDLKVLPTMGLVLALAKPWMHRPESGINFRRMLAGEHGLTLHRPLEPEAILVGETRIDEIVDKGPDKGAILYMSRTVRDKATGDIVYTSDQTYVCRADGGFGGRQTVARPVHPVPDREPDQRVDLPTLPQAALIYRLSGDYNPLHADPELATESGFPRPILHGLCTFAVAGHALLRDVAEYRPEALRSIRVRYSAPVFPGETIRTEIWDEGNGRFAFRCKVLERNLLVLNNGLAEIN